MSEEINADNYWEKLRELELGEDERDAESVNDSITKSQEATKKKWGKS